MNAEGQIDVSALAARLEKEGIDKERIDGAIKQALDADAALRARMSPPGSLKLPPLLEKRRLEFGIVDDYFAACQVYDRVLVYQLDMHEGETMGKDSLIIRPQDKQASDKQGTSRGILVGAGLLALDQLSSHGILLGDIVRFMRLAPFRQEVGKVFGQTSYGLVMRAGDLTSSEDLERRRRSGELTLGIESGQHIWRTPDGEVLRPINPFIGADY